MVEVLYDLFLHIMGNAQIILLLGIHNDCIICDFPLLIWVKEVDTEGGSVGVSQLCFPLLTSSA